MYTIQTINQIQPRSELKSKEGNVVRPYLGLMTIDDINNVDVKRCSNISEKKMWLLNNIMITQDTRTERYCASGSVLFSKLRKSNM